MPPATLASSLGSVLLWAGFVLILAALIVSVALLSRASHARPLVNVGILLTTMMLLLLAGEVAGRIYHRAVYGIPLRASLTVYLDGGLGWGGNAAFGNPDTSRFKILVVGDSFTHGLEVPKDQMYYSVLGRALNAEIFAYGGGGYGTLQEFLVLDRYLPTIRPDLVLLQVSANDFINNQWELERASYFNNNLAVRPYLVGETVEYRFPSSLGSVRPFLTAHSRLFYEAILLVDRSGADFARRGLLHSVETDIEERGLAFAPFRESARTTDAVILRIKRRLGNTPLVVFSVDDLTPYFGQWRAILQRNKIEFVEEVPARIREEETKGIGLRLADGTHWNALGHAVCGKVLADWLSRGGDRGRPGPVPRGRVSRVDRLSSVPGVTRGSHLPEMTRGGERELTVQPVGIRTNPQGRRP